MKICGINNLESARAAVEVGADFLGFNFVPTSRRFIKPSEVHKIIKLLPKSVIKVGIFMNEDYKQVNQLAQYLKLNLVQLHGEELSKYIDLINGAGVIKTISLASDFDLEDTIREMKKYAVDYFLLDRLIQGEGGGLNLNKVRKLTSLFPIILAGGLTLINIKESIRQAKPLIVDVAGGVETDGVKDKEKMAKFIQKVKETL